MFSWVERMASYSREQEQKRDFERWLFDSAVPVVPATSADIQNHAQAAAYWKLKFANKKIKIVVISGKNKNGTPRHTPIHVHFDADNDHAFTKGNLGNNGEKIGGRSFNLERAKAMDKIIPTIQRPSTRFRHHGADLLLERVIDGHHFTVVLQWNTIQGIYTFKSAHPKPIDEVGMLFSGRDTRKSEGPL